MAKWIEVKGYENVPDGVWLVELDDEEGNEKYQVMYKHIDYAVIGHAFAWDVEDVVAYKPLDIE